MATLGTRLCLNNGDTERNGGLEGVETGIRVTEVDGVLKCKPLCEIYGALGLPEAANVVFVEADGVGSCDGDFDEFPTYGDLSPRQHAVSRGTFGDQDPSWN